MEEFVLDWEAPIPFKEPTPPRFSGMPGLYAIVFENEIIYIGKAESQGSSARARQHDFTACLKDQGKIWDASKAIRYFATFSNDQNSARIDDAEKLLVFKLPTTICNQILWRKYKGVIPFKVISQGSRPPGLPEVIQYPYLILKIG